MQELINSAIENQKSILYFIMLYFSMKDPYFVLLSCHKVNGMLIHAMYLHLLACTEFVTF